MSKAWRMFVALKLPGAGVGYISDLQKRLKSNEIHLRQALPGNLHLTLKFLGDVQPKDIHKIESAISRIANSSPPMRLKLQGIGIFPNIRRPRVVWAALRGQINILISLQRNMENALEQIGYEHGHRPFKAHLTVGRIKKKTDTRQLVHAMQTVSSQKSDSFFGTTIVLYRSQLHSGGALYTPLMEAKLTAGNNLNA